MALTVEQLVTKVTKDQALQVIIDYLAGLGFNATAWQSGTIPRSQNEAFAQIYSDLTALVKDMAEGVFNTTSTGDWLSLLAADYFDNSRSAGVATQGKLLLTSAAGSPSHTIDTSSNQIVVADATNGYIYRNTTGGVLTAGSTLEVTIEADTPAANRDVASGTITELKTPLAGVTVNNPTPSGSATWITRNGADPETDAQLRDRNSSKWASLSAAGPGLAYEHFARTASEVVKRVFVDDQNPRGAGTMDIHVAGDSGSVVAAVVSAVSDYLTGVTDGTDRQIEGMDLQVASAVDRSITHEATVYILGSANTTDNQNAIKTAIEDFYKTIPIGGSKQTVGGTGYVFIGELYRQVLTAVTGVVNIIWTSPSADVALVKNEVAVPSFSPGLTYVSV